MILRLSNNTLTRYVNRSGYSAAENVPMQGSIAAVASGLLVWLSAQLAAGETLADIVLEPAGQVSTAFDTQTDEEGNEVQVPTEFRKVISAAVSVMSSLGSRTFVASSETLPDEQRDGLLVVWSELS